LVLGLGTTLFQLLRLWVVEWYDYCDNDELERMWKEALMTHFKVLLSASDWRD
jgi:hypothetical protein